MTASPGDYLGGNKAWTKISWLTSLSMRIISLFLSPTRFPDLLERDTTNLNFHLFGSYVTYLLRFHQTMSELVNTVDTCRLYIVSCDINACVKLLTFYVAFLLSAI